MRSNGQPDMFGRGSPDDPGAPGQPAAPGGAAPAGAAAAPAADDEVAPGRRTFGAATDDDAGADDRLVLGDSAAVAAAWPPASLDAIYVDPPFGTGTVRRGRGAAYRDRPDATDDPDAFVAWLMPWLDASRQALRATGSLFVHLDWRAVHYVKVALDRVFGRGCFAGELVWCYAVGGKSRRGFGRKHDTILWYGRGADWAFYPDQVRVPRRGGSHMRVVTGDDGRPVQEKTDRKTGRVYRYPVDAGKVPEDWWTDVETLNHSDAERTGWPSQKPERLLERVIAAVTRPGDRVADWFAGSGTTAAVAQRLGRGFVVADREPAAIATCVRRLTAQGRALAAAGAPPPALDVTVAAARPDDDRAARRG
ncbi:MAG: site-specific DNA-methyltransferase [Kofleriaceae bacterium]|nr:site-specific DNA-methyltransferase [Kofleriaceae bacterium]